MLSSQKKISFLILAVVFLGGCFFYVRNEIYFAQGSASKPRNIVVEKGDDALVIGEKLMQGGIISGKYFFVFYLWTTDKLHSLIAGVYEFPEGMQIPEVAKILTGGEVVPMSVKVTFPEGWTSKKMAEKLSESGFSSADFLKLANAPTKELIEKYEFLQALPKGASLEGFLFPDTYYFAKDATAEEIIVKILKNFETKVFTLIKQDLISQEKSVFEIVTMASVVEGEVRNDSDRKIVAGLFWNRLKIGMPLQSDATLEYALGTNKFQHSIEETKLDSPYNTYRNKGLPPGPVSNPSLNSIVATLKPQATDFVYFLSDPKTGMTVFAKTYPEHLANKTKYGL
ncbi:MAG: endolytic transglycosylase MltG [Candidatus Moraniibacteriota bacterium]